MSHLPDPELFEQNQIKELTDVEVRTRFIELFKIVKAARRFQIDYYSTPRESADKHSKLIESKKAETILDKHLKRFAFDELGRINKIFIK